MMLFPVTLNDSSYPKPVLAHEWQTIPERGVVRGHVNHLNFGGCQPYLWNVWSSQVRYGQCDKLMTVVGHECITRPVTSLSREAPRRAGLSAALETWSNTMQFITNLAGKFTACRSFMALWKMRTRNSHRKQRVHCVSKKRPTFKLSLALSNLNRFSKLLHCWKAYEICYKSHMTIPTLP